MVGPPARRGDRRFGRRPGRAVARRLFSERGAREVGGLFAYVSSLGFLFCFFLVLLVLRGVSVASICTAVALSLRARVCGEARRRSIGRRGVALLQLPLSRHLGAWT